MSSNLSAVVRGIEAAVWSAPAPAAPQDCSAGLRPAYLAALCQGRLRATLQLASITPKLIPDVPSG